MATKVSYTDVVHGIVSDSDRPLNLSEIVEELDRKVTDNPPKNSRATARSSIRTSGLIKAVGDGEYDWLPRLIRGAHFRHTLHPNDLEDQQFSWDTDLLIALWPAVEEPETRRVREPITWELPDGTRVEIELQEDEETGRYFSDASHLLEWLQECNARVGDDLLIEACDSKDCCYKARFSSRSDRDDEAIESKNRQIKQKIEQFLSTQRGNTAKPREIMAHLVAARLYHDGVAPQTLSQLLPTQIIDQFGVAVPADDYVVEPSKADAAPLQPKSTAPERTPPKVGEIPFNTGRELPDEAAFLEGLQQLGERARPTPEEAIAVLDLSRVCSPAYAILSQTPEYRRKAAVLAGQAVVAAERRMAHALVESLVSGEDFDLEETLADYLEARSFLARALWHDGSQEEAIEQAMHCFEVDPEDPAVREDLFVMLFDTDRYDMVIDLLESFPGGSVTENLYHRALGALLDDPDSKDAKKALRKAVSHNSYLASRFLGEEPKRAKKSSIDESETYEEAYGFLWRREDAIFDRLEEIVLARR